MLPRISVALLACILANHTAFAQSQGSQFTPKQIADKIEEIADQYQSVRYSTIFNVTKSANPFQHDKNTKLVTGNGRTRYTQVGEKWVAEVKSFSVRLGSGEKTSTETGGGFDGQTYWRSDSRAVTLCEEHGGRSNHDPVNIFWHGARNRSWLFTALRKGDAKVVGTENAEGQRCIKIESQYRKYKFRFSIAPGAAFLPLRSECAYDGKVLCVETLSQLQQSKSGLWYPRRIRIDRPNEPSPYVVKRIAVRDLEVVTDAKPQAFSPPRPLGRNIVDQSQGYAFHTDPWWPELAPKLREQFDWPGPDTGELRELHSYEAAVDGKPAPKIAADEWINNDPGAWDRQGRKVTLLHFCFGRAISPMPKRWSSIRRLHQIYGSLGLDVVGVVRFGENPAVVKQAVKMLKIPFPIALDSKGGDDPKSSATYDAVGAGRYPIVLLVDHKGTLHTVKEKNTGFDKPPELEVVVRQLLKEAGIEKLPKVVTPREHEIDNNFRQVIAMWKAAVADGEFRSSISGIVSGGYNAKGPTPLAEATVEIEPFLKMLSSNILNSYITGGDRARKQTTETDKDGKYRFEDLAKGYYNITISANGRAFDKQVLLVSAAAQVSHDAELPSEHTIVGRVLNAADKLSVEDAVIKIVGRHPDPDKPNMVTRSYPQPTTELGTDGIFTFEYLQSGAYILEISAPGFEKREMKMVPLSKKEIVIELKKAP